MPLQNRSHSHARTQSRIIFLLDINIRLRPSNAEFSSGAQRILRRRVHPFQLPARSTPAQRPPRALPQVLNNPSNAPFGHFILLPAASQSRVWLDTLGTTHCLSCWARRCRRAKPYP